MPPSLEIRLFGPPSVQIDGVPMPRLKTRKGMWLLALLALRHDRDVDRNWLAGTLWPNAEETIALNYLRQTLTDLRKALGPASDYVESPGSRSLRLDLSSADCDAVRFDQLVTRGTPAAYEEAAALYSGPLLEGCTEEWVFQERESRSQLWLRALEGLARHEIEAGNAASAVYRLRQAVAAEPLRESIYRELMRSLAALGDVAAVMETYRDLRLLVRQELNIEPDPETRALFDAIRSEARSRAAASAGPSVVFLASPPDAAEQTQMETTEAPSAQLEQRHSEPTRAARVRLPRFVSGFIGREREIGAVKRCLAASRLVTLTGVGGVGKTRLAVRIAEEEAGRFTDGTTFVDLAPLTESSLVAVTIATALGLRERPPRATSDMIADYLETRSMMLVLDNCEHVLAGCAEVTSNLLKRCPEMQVLATSRQCLRIAGETEWRVPPLEVPPASIPVDASAARDLLRGNEALALFMDRALRVRPTLVTDIDMLRDVADICRRLDGLPLALELAAARLQALSVSELAEMLEARFNLLVTGDVTAPGRQQTLRALLDWSHDLLTEDEKKRFRRLSVFVGGWSLKAAELVCFGNACSAIVVLNGLSRLVDKSLVLFSDIGGKGRYGLLETVRQYGREKLVRSGEESELRRLHRDYFEHFAEEAAGHLTGPDQAEWLDRLEAEHDNLRAALDWCAEEPENTSAGLRMAGALNRFWFLRSHFAEGRRRYADLLDRDAHGPPTPERALALQGAGSLAYRQGDYAAAREMFEQALTITLQREDRARSPELMTYLGNVAYFQGDYERARTYFTQALDLHRSVGNHAGALTSLYGLGNLAFASGDLAMARGLFEQGLAESQACGSRAMEATVLVSLGLLLEAEDKGPAAPERFEQALSICREIGDVSGEMACQTNLGNVYRKLGHPVLSAQFYRAGLLGARERPGNRDERVVAYLLEGVAFLAAGASDFRQAAWLLAAGDAIRESIAAPRPPQDQQELDRELARVHAALDPQAFDSAWTQGRTARGETAISKALEMVA